MTRLSACYFCGLALDEPLADYQLAPDQTPADRAADAADVTVSLCETCEEKLDRVLEVVDPADDSVADADVSGDANTHVGTNDAPETVEGSTQEGDMPEDTVDPLAAQTDADATDDLDDPEGETGRTSEPDPPESRDAGDAAEGERAAGAGGEAPGAGTDESTTDQAETGRPTTRESEADEPAADGPAADGPAADEPADEPDPAHDVESADGSEPTDDPESADDPETADAGGGGGQAQRSVVEGQHSISALEYNKVMRLLQNREFPVDREEIVTVAANAYGLGRSECAKVIDVAVDRGLIEEADGQLRQPDNA